MEGGHAEATTASWKPSACFPHHEVRTARTAKLEHTHAFAHLDTRIHIHAHSAGKDQAEALFMDKWAAKSFVIGITGGKKFLNDEFNSRDKFVSKAWKETKHLTEDKCFKNIIIIIITTITSSMQIWGESFRTLTENESDQFFFFLNLQIPAV